MNSPDIQFFRAIAIIAVVTIHTTSAGEMQVICKPFINFAVATFIFLSGYLTKADSDNWLAFHRRRITRVLVPYFIWTVIYSIQDIQSEGLSVLVKNLLFANATTTLYYIFVYIQFVLLTPLLSKLAKSRFRHLGWIIAPLSVVLFKYIPAFGEIHLGKHVELLWSDACLGWFTFYYLGLILGNKILSPKFNLHADHIQRAKQQSWDEVPSAQHNRRLLVWNIPCPYDDLEGVGTYGALLSNPLSGNISYHTDNQFYFL